jgi:hypothetical protein
MSLSLDLSIYPGYERQGYELKIPPCKGEVGGYLDLSINTRYELEGNVLKILPQAGEGSRII